MRKDNGTIYPTNTIDSFVAGLRNYLTALSLADDVTYVLDSDPLGEDCYDCYRISIRSGHNVYVFIMSADYLRTHSFAECLLEVTEEYRAKREQNGNATGNSRE